MTDPLSLFCHSLPLEKPYPLLTSINMVGQYIHCPFPIFSPCIMIIINASTGWRKELKVCEREKEIR